MKMLKTNFRFVLGLMLMLSTLITSCDPKDEAIAFEPGNDNETELDLGSNIQRDFIGRIVDESNAPIENVVVSIGSQIEVTDANGMFIINNANVTEKQAFIVAEKPGYLKGMRSVVPTQGTNNIRIMLVAENVVATVSSGADSEVNLPNGTTVKFDGSFKDESGNAYTGNVDVIMYHLDPSNPSIDDIMPGSLQAQNSNGDERVLESFGMLNVELRGASGEELNIADGHFAEIELPLDPAQSGVAPSTIPLWHFDEVKGYWVEDGEADLIGGKYVAEVSHFSWWNCDAQFPTVTLCLNVVDNANMPLTSVIVQLWKAGDIYPRTGVSNANGEICGLIPANEILTLNAYNQCGVLAFTTTIGPFATNTNYGSIVISGVATTTITGNLVDCANANVTNGYVDLNYGNQYTAVAVTNGSFSFTVISCALTAPTFELEGVDYTSFQTTNVLTFNTATPNVGNIIACNAVTEFVSVQVDTNPVEFFLSSISADQFQQGNGFSIYSSSTTSAFYIGVYSTTPGIYPYNNGSGFSIEANIDMDYNIPNTLQFTLTNYGAVGQYIDGTITGTFTDINGVVKNLAVTVHVIRDN